MSDYLLSEDPADLDMDRVVRWISGDAYWAKGRPPEVVERSFANSFPAGLYGTDDRPTDGPKAHEESRSTQAGPIARQRGYCRNDGTCHKCRWLYSRDASAANRAHGGYHPAPRAHC